MFTEWLKNNDIEKQILSLTAYHPYPTSLEREAWLQAPISDEKRNTVLTYADQYRRYDWPSLSATDFMAFGRKGRREPYESRRDPRRRILSGLVLAACMEGRGTYTDDIINGIWHICEESYWGISAHLSPFAYDSTPDPLPDCENPYIDIAAANTAGLLAHTLYLLRGELEVESRRLIRRIQKELTERIIQPFLQREDFWWMGFSGAKLNNWNPWIVSNLISVFLLVETDAYTRKIGLTKCLLCLDHFVASYCTDGGCDEGTSYWNVAAGALFDCLEQLDRASDGRVSFWQDPLIREMGAFIQRAHIAEDYFINFADGAARVDMDCEMVYRFGNAIGNRKMMQLAASFPIRKDERIVPNHVGRFLRSIFYGSAPKNGTYMAEDDVWMSGIQVMASRQYTKSVKGFYLAAKGGHNDESHNHNDVGSCIVYYDGRPLLIDIGVENYTKKTFSDERYTIWTMQSAFHNLPTLNTYMQSAGRAFCATSVMYTADEQDTIFSLDLAQAYPQGAGIGSYIRRYHLRKGDGGYIEIKDSYCFLQDSNRLSLHFICHQKPEIIEGYVCFYNDTGCVRMQFDSEVFLAEVEAYSIADPKLCVVWGDCLYRVVLKARTGKIGKKGESVFILRSIGQASACTDSP